MRKSSKTSFFLVHAKKNVQGLTPIYLRISCGDNQITSASGVCVSSVDWDKKKKRVKGRGEKEQLMNQTLDALEIKVKSRLNQLLLAREDVSHSLLKSTLGDEVRMAFTVDEAFELYLNQIKPLVGKGYTDNTVDKYKQTQSRFKDFIQHKFKRKNFNVRDLDDNVAEEFEMYLRLERSNNKTTVSKHWQRLSAVVKNAVRKKKVNEYPFLSYKLRPERCQIDYLTNQEIEKIRTKDFGVPRLNKVRDIYLFAIFTGLPYKEMKNLQRRDLVYDNDEQRYINMTRQKTGQPYKVPLVPFAIELLDTFFALPHFKDKGVIPIPTNQKMNGYLKEIQEVCGIDTNLTCHLARRTFACTVLLGNGVSIAVARKLLGHASMQITISAYATVQNELLRQEFGQLVKRLEENNSQARE